MNDFETQAINYLKALFTRIDASLGDTLEVDFIDPLLTITLDDHRQFLIHIHRPNEEIWLSSPLSGATHFYFDPTTQTWISKKNRETLHDKLFQELHNLTGVSL